MKTKLILLTLALGASACLLTAQDGRTRPDGQRPPGRQGGPGGERGGPGGPGGTRMPVPIIEALDLNKDGTLDADEIAKATASLLKLDKNADGKLTPEEYRPQRREGQGERRGPGGPGGGEGGPQRPQSE